MNDDMYAWLSIMELVDERCHVVRNMKALRDKMFQSFMFRGFYSQSIMERVLPSRPVK